ncbi:hypothetical protein PBY51_003515 [Eleginops maclovinus]|uniref:TELO2-interacting protein 2 n=1 Tax=Eleginops maclovinus TaxID=56733 RepID=A0AAN7Y0X5_ELEMC|nr:hypothetical protein PBY51_003515 [Eleginops maclovinus]
MSMELSSLLHDLHLSPSPSSDKLLPSSYLPPITELLSRLQEKLIDPPSDSETNALIGHVEQLFKKADPNWLFSANQDEGWAELQEAYSNLVSALIGCAALPICEDDCSSLPAVAYRIVPSLAQAVCSALTALLGTMGNGGSRSGLLLALAPHLCVFAVTHFQDQPWTSSSSRAGARSLQEVLLRTGGWRDSPHLLMGDGTQTNEGEEEGKNRGIFGGILDILQPQLTKDLWHRCEAVKLVFAWTLLQVTRPSLSPHLSRLLPPSLLLTDNYRQENCILGVCCLHHIVLNTPAADLRQFNRAEVLYQALFKQLYTTDAAVIQPVLSCLLDLLVVLEKPPSSLAPSSCRRKPCRHDDVLRLVLTHMEAEHKLELRRVYASALPLYMDRMGVAVCRHLRQVERVVLGYLEVTDPPEETSRLKILEVLQKTTRAAWPRMACRVAALLRCLLKLLVAVSSDRQLSDSVKQKLMSETSLCLKLLDGCCHGDLQLPLRQVDSSCCCSEVLGCLATITGTTERCCSRTSET